MNENTNSTGSTTTAARQEEPVVIKQEELKVLQRVEKLEKSILTKEALIVEKIVKNIAPHLKYIATKLIVHDDEFYNGNHYQGTVEYWGKKAFTIVKKYEDPATGQHKGFRDGFVIVLDESGRLVKFDREGTWSNWQNTPDPLYLEAPQEINPDKLLESISVEEFCTKLRDAFNNAFEKSKTRENELKTRIKELDEILEHLK